MDIQLIMYIISRLINMMKNDIAEDSNDGYDDDDYYYYKDNYDDDDDDDDDGGGK